MDSKLKEKFELSEETRARLVNATKGNMIAHAWAIMEGYAKEATVRALRNAIRDTGAFTLGNEPIGAGYKACAVTAVNGKPFADDNAKAEFVAEAIVTAKAEHAARVAADRAKKAADKKAAEAQGEADKAKAAEAEAALRKSDVLKKKVADLESWIADATVKLTSAKEELRSALLAEAEETSKNVALLTSFYTAQGLDIPADIAAIIDMPEVKTDLELAKEHAAFLAKTELAREQAVRAKEAIVQAESAVPAPAPAPADPVESMLTERAESFDAAIMAQNVARRARKSKKVA